MGRQLGVASPQRRPAEDAEPMLAVDYQGLAVVQSRALQQLNARYAALEARLAALEAKLA